MCTREHVEEALKMYHRVMHRYQASRGSETNAYYAEFIGLYNMLMKLHPEFFDSDGVLKSDATILRMVR
jgi:hypothetical protein